MRRLRSLAMTFALALAATAAAAVPSSTTEIRFRDGHSVRVSAPPGWSIHSNFLGVPVMVLGPESLLPVRPTFSLSGTEWNLMGRFDDDSLAAKQDEYAEGRRRWASKHNFLIDGFIPFSKRRIGKEGQIEARAIGVRYRMRGKLVEETSLFFFCRGNLLLGNVLMATDLPAAHKREMESLLENLSCR